MADVFVGRLRKLSGADKQALMAARTAPGGPVLLRSAFDMPPRQRSMIESAVKDTLGPETEIQFETAPELVSGVELTVNGHKLAWSIEDYLTSLANHVSEVVEKRTERNPEPKRGAKAKQETAEHALRQLAKPN